MKNKLRTMIFILPVLFLVGCASNNTYCPPTPIIKHSINASQLLSDLKVISSDAMLGRETGTLGNIKAQQYLQARYKEIGLNFYNANYTQSFNYGKDNNKKGTNIVGWLPGKKNDAQYIVITAHYDHIGHQDSKVFNGADDNASGVAAMLTLARKIKEVGSNNSVIFVATDAEEKGLWGSKHFVNFPPIKLEDIQYNINLDMVARGEVKNRLYVSGTRKNNILKTLITNASLSSGVCLRRGHEGKEKIAGSVSMKMDWSKVSDHAPFLKQNIPYLYFGVAPHRDYHQPTDIYDNIDPHFFTAAVESIVDVFVQLDSLQK